MKEKYCWMIKKVLLKTNYGYRSWIFIHYLKKENWGASGSAALKPGPSVISAPCQHFYLKIDPKFHPFSEYISGSKFL
jgi:hypothetical protein